MTEHTGMTAAAYLDVISETTDLEQFSLWRSAGTEILPKILRESLK
jgi:hypothetical protein